MLAAMVTVALAGPWTPVPGADIVPAAHGWRDGRVASQVQTFDAAVDARERLVLASVEGADGALIVRRWDGDAWTTFPLVASFPKDGKRGRWLSVAVAAAEDVVVAWAEGETVTVRRWGGDAWETVLERTISWDEFAVSLEDGVPTVWAVDKEQLRSSTASEDWSTVAEARWWGRTRAIAGTVTWRPEPRGWRRGVLVPSAGGPAPTLRIRGEARFIGTHYDAELNRLRVYRGLRTFTPPGLRWMPVPHQLYPETLVFETRPPLMVTRDGGDLIALAWTGRTWWGLDRAEGPLPSFSTAPREAFQPTFVPAGDRRVLRWVEQDDRLGTVFVERRLDGGAPRQTGIPRPTTGDEPCRGDRGWWMPASRQRPASAILTSLCGGTWDRVWGTDALLEPFVWSTGRLRRLPVPESCGHDPARERCELRAVDADASGVLALSAISPIDEEDLDGDASPWRAWRWHRGWVPDAALVAESAFAEPHVFAGREPLVVFELDDEEDDTQRHFLHVQARGPDGWRRLATNEEALATVFAGPMYGWTVNPSIEVARAADALWIAWNIGTTYGSSQLAVARWMEAEGWVRLDPDMTEVHAAELALAVAPSGAPHLAWANEEGVHVLGWDGSRWGPPDHVWTGPATGVALAGMGDALCVAWSAWTALGSRIGASCAEGR